MSDTEISPEIVRNSDGTITIVLDFDYSLDEFYAVVLDCLNENE